MSSREWVLEKLDFDITDMHDYNCDLYIYANSTADDYEVFIFQEEYTSRYDFENEVYMYKDELGNEFKEFVMCHMPANSGCKIYMDFEEDYIPDWIWDEIKQEILEGDED